MPSSTGVFSTRKDEFEKDAKQYKDFTGNDPYQYTLCENRMVFTGFTIGPKNNELLDNRRMSMREITATWGHNLG